MDQKVSLMNELPQPSEGSSRFGLTRLIFSLVGIFGAYRVFLWVAGYYLLKSFQSSPNTAVGVVAGLAYPATAIFILVEMLVVVWIYRPVRGLFDGLQPKPVVNLWVREALVGAGAGLLVFLVAIPFLKDISTRTFFLTIIPTIRPLEPRGVMYAILLGLALPTAGEMVFRGIVLRTLQAYSSSLASILVSTLLFALVWPLFGVAVSILLGALTSLLYTWRRSLVSPIFASVVMTLSGGLYVLWKIWS